MLEFFYWQYICWVWWTCISTDSRHSYNCAPFHTDLSLYSYEAVFIQGLLKKNEKKLARAFNFTFCYYWSHLSHWAWNKGYYIYS